MKKILWAIGVPLAFVSQGWAQAPQLPTSGLPVPLLPGESFAWASADGAFKGFGEDLKEAPMGSLAKLLWLRIEGEEWAARMVTYKCKGELNGLPCSNRKGHGKVNLAKATTENCNLAFLVWSMESAERWKKDYGEGVARYRLEQIFKPFLGTRLNPGDTLPVLGPEWIGDGDLLRTTPLAMAKWLADPEQGTLLALCKRLIGGIFDGWIIKGAEWWFEAGIAPVFSASNDPNGTSVWVAGSNDDRSVVLHLSKGRGKAEGLARMKAILLLPKK